MIQAPGFLMVISRYSAVLASQCQYRLLPCIILKCITKIFFAQNLTRLPSCSPFTIDCLDLKSKSDLDCVQNEWANVCFGKIDLKKTFRTFVSEKLQSTKNFGWVFTKYFYKHLAFILMGRLLMIKGSIQFQVKVLLLGAHMTIFYLKTIVRSFCECPAFGRRRNQFQSERKVDSFEKLNAVKVRLHWRDFDNAKSHAKFANVNAP